MFSPTDISDVKLLLIAFVPLTCRPPCRSQQPECTSRGQLWWVKLCTVLSKIGTCKGTCVCCAIFVGIIWCTLEPLMYTKIPDWTEHILSKKRISFCTGSRCKQNMRLVSHASILLVSCFTRLFQSTMNIAVQAKRCLFSLTLSVSWRQVRRFEGYRLRKRSLHSELLRATTLIYKQYKHAKCKRTSREKHRLLSIGRDAEEIINSRTK